MLAATCPTPRAAVLLAADAPLGEPGANDPDEAADPRGVQRGGRVAMAPSEGVADHLERGVTP
jgi:hypothetical protein